MANKFKKMMAIFLAVVMCVSMIGTTAFAQTITENGTVWYGDELSVPVTAGTDGYTFQSVYTAPAHMR